MTDVTRESAALWSVVHSSLTLTTYCWKGYYWSAAYKWWLHSHPSSSHIVCPDSENWKQTQSKTETTETYVSCLLSKNEFFVIVFTWNNTLWAQQTYAHAPSLVFTHGLSISSYLHVLDHSCTFLKFFLSQSPCCCCKWSVCSFEHF